MRINIVNLLCFSDLSWNNISKIEDGTFEGLPELKTL